MRKRGLLLFLLAMAAWTTFAVLCRLEMAFWGAAAALALSLLVLLLLPRGHRFNILSAFSLLFFAVATAAVPALGETLTNRLPNLLAGGFATLCIMAGYGALEGALFPAHFLELDYPESMRRSPILRRAFWVVTLAWNLLFLAGLVAGLVSMLALRESAALLVSSTFAIALFGLGILITPLVLSLLPRRMEVRLVEKGPLAPRWKPPLLTPGTSRAANEFDAVVVGSGIGGLACAALLSQAGMKVLVAEKGRLAGGYSQTYEWEGYPLNSGPTVLLGGGEGGVLNALLRRLDLEHRVPMRRLSWGIANGRLALRLGQGAEPDMEKLSRKFPTCREGLQRLLSDLRRFRGELRDRADYLSSPLPSSIEDYHEQFIRHPLSAHWQNLSFREMLEDYLDDDRLVDLLGRLSTILGGEPSTFPAYEGARLLVSLFIDGIHYPAVHMSGLVEALAEKVRRGGGRITTSCGVEEILLRGEGTASVPLGVRLADGTQARSGVVILDVDPRRAAGGLLPPSALGSDFLREMERLRPSPSAFLLHLIFEEELRIPDRVFLFPARPRRVRTGDTFVEIDSLILSREASTKAPHGGCVLMVRANIPAACFPAFEDQRDSEELGTELTALVKEELASVLPAVKRAVKEFVTLPTHLARLASHGQGAAFGFAPLLTQWYFRRPGPRLAPANLYLVGGWSRYGGGLEGAVLSGAVVARELCGESPYGSAGPSSEYAAVRAPAGEGAPGGRSGEMPDEEVGTGKEARTRKRSRGKREDGRKRRSLSGSLRRGRRAEREEDGEDGEDGED
ncbi:FAD-dependent oxidoreductase [Candidatus Solincola sp.]|nr:FAD-dependent oxidoreductase [Actinomycetota bacterium]MDI7253082.1 FAD-dependent oxidoreductase [Actinomycetota bacterium]